MNTQCLGRKHLDGQATGKNDQLFGGISIILIGDPAQLPPVGDKPLYHSVPSSAVGEQGYCAYYMFNKAVILTENKRERIRSRTN